CFTRDQQRRSCLPLARKTVRARSVSVDSSWASSQSCCASGSLFLLPTKDLSHERLIDRFHASSSRCSFLTAAPVCTVAPATFAARNKASSNRRRDRLQPVKGKAVVSICSPLYSLKRWIGCAPRA